MLHVTIEDLGNVVVLRCAGRIVLGDESAILCAASRHHGRNILLDLAEVEAVDAAGIGALISLQAAGIYLKLMNPSKHLRQLLKITDLESVFEICEPIMNAGVDVGKTESRPLLAGVGAN